jgi:hypothetical protein
MAASPTMPKSSRFNDPLFGKSPRQSVLIDADYRKSELYGRIAFWFIYGSFALTLSIFLGSAAWQSWATSLESYAVGIACFTSIIALTFALRFFYRKHREQIDSAFARIESFARPTMALPLRFIWYLVRMTLKSLVWCLLRLWQYFIPIFFGWLIAEALHLGSASWIPIIACIFAWQFLKAVEDRQIEIQKKQHEILSELHSLRR